MKFKKGDKVLVKTTGHDYQGLNNMTGEVVGIAKPHHHNKYPVQVYMPLEDEVYSFTLGGFWGGDEEFDMKIEKL